jgi:hypothetical protein
LPLPGGVKQRQKTSWEINFPKILPITAVSPIPATIPMAKDLVDFHTLDILASASVDISCGQVLTDRHRHIAIVAKKGRACAYLVQVKSGMLKLTRHATADIATNWLESDYQYERALDRLTEMGRRKGITDSARVALDSLRKNGKEPVQRMLFG